jgi:hypothetical protein
VAAVLPLIVVVSTAGIASAQVDVAQETTVVPPPTEPPPTTAAPTTAPTVTTAPTTTSAGTTTTTTTGGDGDDGTDATTWLIVALIVVAIVLAVAALFAALARSRGARHAGSQAGYDARRSRLDQLVGTSRWVHDQVSLEVLGGAVDAEQLRMRWQDARRRMMDLSSQASAASVEPADPLLQEDLRTLGQAVTNLAGALDTNVSLRTTPAENARDRDQALLQSSDDVARRRTELQMAADRVAAHR